MSSRRDRASVGGIGQPARAVPTGNLAGPAVINQSLFENIWVSTGLMRKAHVVGATFAEPPRLLARGLPEHLSREAERPELVLSRVGSNSDFLVPPGGLGPDLRRLVRLRKRLPCSVSVDRAPSGSGSLLRAEISSVELSTLTCQI
jgi:hypothetical protein